MWCLFVIIAKEKVTDLTKHTLNVFIQYSFQKVCWEQELQYVFTLDFVLCALWGSGHVTHADNLAFPFCEYKTVDSTLACG